MPEAAIPEMKAKFRECADTLRVSVWCEESAEVTLTDLSAQDLMALPTGAGRRSDANLLATSPSSLTKKDDKLRKILLERLLTRKRASQPGGPSWFFDGSRSHRTNDGPIKAACKQCEWLRVAHKQIG